MWRDDIRLRQHGSDYGQSGATLRAPNRPPGGGEDVTNPEPSHPLLRFVTAAEIARETSPWGTRESLSRPGFTDAERLLLIRVFMHPGRAHQFHRHPAMEEIIYVISGSAEQWVEQESRILGPGDVAHIPADVVHGTYNAGQDTLVFLAILSPAKSAGPATVDVYGEEPWCSLKRPVDYPAGAG
jgi:quercetin dioxygenase-like cupin family protein